MRVPTQALTEGTRSELLPLSDRLNLAFSACVQATPASPKKNSSVGMNPVARPNSFVPNSGMRTSALAMAILDPNSRSNTGHELGFEAVGTHSLRLMESNS